MAWVVSWVYDDDDDEDDQSIQSLPECGGMNETINVSDTLITTVILPILQALADDNDCLLYTSPSPRDGLLSRMPSSA